MSNYHILETISPTLLQVVWHVYTPTGTNDAGIEWCTCMMDSCRCTPTSVVPSLVGAVGLELIKQCKVVEICERFEYSSAELTAEEKLAEIEARFNVVKSSVQSDIESKFAKYGTEGDVA